MNSVRAETAGLSGQHIHLLAPLRRLNEGDYIVVWTARHQLLFISNSRVVLKAACLTGSGKEFIDPVDGRKWVFDTPRGEFYITSKVQDLVWRRPDWTFTGKDRFENGVVEDYAWQCHAQLHSRRRPGSPSFVQKDSCGYTATDFLKRHLVRWKKDERIRQLLSSITE